jgi:hypothetical protein
MKNNDFFILKKKFLFWISPIAAIVVVLIARDNAPEALLFLIGVVCGFLLRKQLF